MATENIAELQESSEESPEDSFVESCEKDSLQTFSEGMEVDSLQAYAKELSQFPEVELPDIQPHTEPIHEVQFQEHQNLPIWKKKNEFMQLLKNNKVVILEGETGCGKTTQIPQWCVEYTERKQKVVCTQPRRLAATTLAERVAEEMGFRLGEEVGYHVRCDNCTSPGTILKYMTDDVLVKQIASDCMLSQYGVVVLDETHERRRDADILMGLVDAIVRERDDFRLVVMSATLDLQRFKDYFQNPPVLSVLGRLHPVEVIHSLNNSGKWPVTDAVDKVKEIHKNETARGDILIFLPGQREIAMTCVKLENWVNSPDYQYGELRILPLHSELSKEDQEMVFQPTPPDTIQGISRKVIVSTNVAETSITLDGIVFVIDCGYMNSMVYQRETKAKVLSKVRISKTIAQQRAGRAGRTRPGKCFRLYKETTFNSLDPFVLPEVLRSNLSAIILDMKRLGVKNVANFNFMDPPDAEAILVAQTELRQLCALDKNNEITGLGSVLAQFPVDPRVARMVVAGCVEYGCTEDIMTIGAMLSVPRVFIWSHKKTLQIKEARKRFSSCYGDHITLLKLYNAFVQNGESEEWCRDNFLHYRYLKLAVSLRFELKVVLQNLGLDQIVEAKFDPEYTVVRKALLSGFRLQIAFKDQHGRYRTLYERDTPIKLHGSTGLTSPFPDFVIYHERVTLKEPFIFTVTPIESKWWNDVVKMPVRDLLRL